MLLYKYYDKVIVQSHIPIIVCIWSHYIHQLILKQRGRGNTVVLQTNGFKNPSSLSTYCVVVFVEFIIAK